MKKMIVSLSLLATITTAFAAPSAKGICDGKVNSDPIAETALGIATFANLKPQIKDLLFNKCISIETTKEQVLPSAFYAQDAEVLNWFLQRGYNIEEDNKSVSTVNILMYKIAAASTDKMPQPTMDAPTSKILKEKYNIDMATLPYRKFNTPSDIALINQIATQMPDSMLQDTDNESYNALHYAIRFGQTDAIKILTKRDSELYYKKNSMGYPPITMIWAKPCIDENKRGLAAYTTLVSTPTTALEDKLRPDNLIGAATLDPNAMDYALMFKDVNPTNELIYKWTAQRMGSNEMLKATGEVQKFKKENPKAYKLASTIAEITNFCSRSTNP
jgi:hypothetical protein